MAINSRDKRFSLLGFAHGWQSPYVVPNPDGTISEPDRAQWIYLYHGITLMAGQPIMRRWGGVPHMGQPVSPFGRSW